MTVTVSQVGAELADREAIRDCLARYCRGIDRSDAEGIRSAYWPGALEHYSGTSRTIEDFIEWALPQLAGMEQAVHLIGNVLIRIENDRAKVETYFWSVAVVPGENPHQTMIVGRYLDRFEKRADEWRIAERTVAHDWFEDGPATGDWDKGPFGMPGLLRGAPATEDASRTWLGL